MDEMEIEHGKDCERFLQDGLVAWSDFKATGLHATAAEAEAWLARLEAGENAEAPECHV